jgi:hypothetical protein
VGPTQLLVQWVPGALSLGVKRPGVKLTTQLHLVPRSRMSGAIPPLPVYVFMAWCLVKHRDNFTFFTFYRRVQTGSEAHPASCPVPRALIPGVKRPGMKITTHTV